MKQMFQDKFLVQFEIVNVPNEALRVEGSSGNRHGLVHTHTQLRKSLGMETTNCMVLTLSLIPFFSSAVGWFKVVKKV